MVIKTSPVVDRPQQVLSTLLESDSAIRESHGHIDFKTENYFNSNIFKFFFFPRLFQEFIFKRYAKCLKIHWHSIIIHIKVENYCILMQIMRMNVFFGLCKRQYTISLALSRGEKKKQNIQIQHVLALSILFCIALF